MRSVKIFSIAATLAGVVLVLTAFINTKLLKTVNAGNSGFAVVELFTSEGCSSCPPADELVSKIQGEDIDKPVYILAYHVDYWNRLGWKDAFSSAEYSKRQSQYASFLKLNSVYTPQIVVNGTTEFVGSEEKSLRRAIKTSLAKKPEALLNIEIAAINRNEAKLTYTTAGADKNTTLLIAVLQKNAQTKVEHGENGGQTLSHVQIVRKIQAFVLTGNNGEASIDLPAGFDTKKWEIIGFLQNKANGSVIGAGRVN